MMLNDENFDKEVLQSQKPFLVDFFAEWCGPCQMMGPVIEKVAEDYKDKINFGKMNVDSAPVQSQKYQVSSIPTVMLFKGGKPEAGFMGARAEDFIKQFIDENI
jgi:thioredoxin 1